MYEIPCVLIHPAHHNWASWYSHRFLQVGYICQGRTSIDMFWARKNLSIYPLSFIPFRSTAGRRSPNCVVQPQYRRSSRNPRVQSVSVQLHRRLAHFCSDQECSAPPFRTSTRPIPGKWMIRFAASALTAAKNISTSQPWPLSLNLVILPIFWTGTFKCPSCKAASWSLGREPELEIAELIPGPHPLGFQLGVRSAFCHLYPQAGKKSFVAVR